MRPKSNSLVQLDSSKPTLSFDFEFQAVNVRHVKNERPTA
jgi:hypothetical protein